MLAVYNGVQTREVEGTQVAARLPTEHPPVQQQRDAETTAAAQQAATQTQQREAAQQRERVSVGQQWAEKRLGEGRAAETAAPAAPPQAPL